MQSTTDKEVQPQYVASSVRLDFSLSQKQTSVCLCPQEHVTIKLIVILK